MTSARSLCRNLRITLLIFITANPMRIGIDLDNTLVCYDRLFRQLAVERGWIAPQILARKELVRDELRRLGREADWTLLQGEVYGSRMNDAEPFPEALLALQGFRNRNWSVCIVSHRTKTPYAGPPADLHAAARNWLKEQRFLEASLTGLSQEHVFLETTKAEKLARIESSQLTWFIDDLPEFLLDPAFPVNVQRMLFDPHRHGPTLPGSVAIAHHWRDVADLLSGNCAP